MTSASSPAPSVSAQARATMSARNLWSGILFGVGLVAFVDEVVFHQLLQWHHFYDLSTPRIGVISDGLFHAVSWGATIGGLFMLADLRRRRAFWQTRWWGGVLLGAGGFQLYDGLVQHKLFGIHQIRYVSDVLTYDVVWNVIAAVLVIAGAVIAVRTRRSVAEARAREAEARAREAEAGGGAEAAGDERARSRATGGDQGGPAAGVV